MIREFVKDLPTVLRIWYLLWALWIIFIAAENVYAWTTGSPFWPVVP